MKKGALFGACVNKISRNEIRIYNSFYISTLSIELPTWRCNMYFHLLDKIPSCLHLMMLTYHEVGGSEGVTLHFCQKNKGGKWNANSLWWLIGHRMGLYFLNNAIISVQHREESKYSIFKLLLHSFYYI